MAKDQERDGNKFNSASYGELAKALDAYVAVKKKDGAEVPISSVISSDLISDILMFVEERPLLLTGLVNPQVIRVADMVDIGGIIFVGGKKPEEGMIEMARQKEMPLAITERTLYGASGELYKKGIKPCKYGGGKDLAKLSLEK